MPISVDVYSRWDVVKEILTVAPAGFGDRFTLKQRTANVHAQLEPPGGEVVIYAAYADTGRWADSIGQKNLDAMRGCIITARYKRVVVLLWKPVSDDTLLKDLKNDKVDKVFQFLSTSKAVIRSDREYNKDTARLLDEYLQSPYTGDIQAASAATEQKGKKIEVDVYAFKDDFIKDLEKWLPPEFHDKFTLLNRGKEVLSDPPEPKKTVIYIHFDATGRWVAQITPTKLEALRAKYRKVIILLQKLSVDAYPHRDAGVDSLSWVIVDTDRFITPNTDNQKRVADIYKALLEFHADDIQAASSATEQKGKPKAVTVNSSPVANTPKPDPVPRLPNITEPKKMATPAWRKFGLPNIDYNCYSNALLVSIFNLPGMEKAMEGSTGERRQKLLTGFREMRATDSQELLDAWAKYIQPTMYELATAKQKKGREHEFQDPVELFENLLEFLGYGDTFARVFRTTVFRGEAELSVPHLTVDNISDFDARLCDPASTMQDEYQISRYANTIFVVHPGTLPNEKPIPFRCSKAPLRFPIWYIGTKDPDGRVKFPSEWSDWYQLIGVIGGTPGHYTATALTEGSNWTYYNDAEGPRKSEPGHIIPRVLIFSKIHVPAEAEMKYFAYNKRRMLAAAEWYNAKNENFRATPGYSAPPSFDVRLWEDGFTSAGYNLGPNGFDYSGERLFDDDEMSATFDGGDLIDGTSLVGGVHPPWKTGEHTGPKPIDVFLSGCSDQSWKKILEYMPQAFHDGRFRFSYHRIYDFKEYEKWESASSTAIIVHTEAGRWIGDITEDRFSGIRAKYTKLCVVVLKSTSEKGIKKNPAKEGADEVVFLTVTNNPGAPLATNSFENQQRIMIIERFLSDLK